MFIPKRQYDLAPEGVPSAPSVAQMMATQGTIAQEGTQTVEAAPHNEPSTPAPASEPPAPAVTATEGGEVAPAGEPAVPATEPAAEPPAATEPTPAPQVSWQDLIKTQPREQVLQELGVAAENLSLAQTLKENPQMEAFFKHWQQKGDVKEYLRELTTDYKEMPAEDVMRRQLREDYPRATEKQLELLYRKEVVEKYGLDALDEETVEEGRLLLEAHAERYRDKFAEAQKNFLIPPPAEKPAAAPVAEVDNSQAQVEAYKQTVTADPLFQSLSQTKAFTLGDGDEKFTFPVDPQEVSGVLFDTERWAEKMFVRQGDTILPNMKNTLLVGMVATYGDKFLNAYAQHYRALGGKTVLDPVENASAPSAATPSQAQVTPDNPAAAMAKHGRVSY